MADLGDTLTFHYDFYNVPAEQGGVLTNVPTVALTVTLPDGTTSTPTVTNPPILTGKYTADYVTTGASPAGRYVGSWLFTPASGKTVSYVETFDVGGALITVDEAIAHLRAGGILDSGPTATADLEQLQWLCFVATDAVERDLGRIIVRRTVTEVYDGGRTVILLRSTPVISITTVVEGVTTLTSGDYILRKTAGILQRGTTTAEVTWSYGWENITVTSVVGYNNPPYVAREVAMATLQALWQESQQSSHPLLDETADFAVQNAVAGLPDPLKRAYEHLGSAGFA